MNFGTLGKYLDTLPGEGFPSVAISVWQNHREIFRHAAGKRDLAGEICVSPADYYWLYSATKVIVCAGAMQLVEQGKMALDAPVSEYLPAWKNVRVRDGETLRPPKRPVTIRHLMAMQGGLNYDLQSASVKAALAKYGKNATTRQITDAIAQEPLDFDPGDHFQYSLCHDVLGAAMEVASGMTLGEYLQKNIFDPCGMDTITFHATPMQMEHMTAQYIRSEAEKKTVPFEQCNCFALSDCYESGGAGLICRVDDYIRFADAMASGGVAATGARILKPETIDIMRTNQQHPQALREFREKTHNKLGYGYACGVRTMMEPGMGPKSPMGEFGWDGAAGCYALIDPQNGLSAFFAMQVRGFTDAYTVVHPTIRDMIYETLDSAAKQ